MAEQRSLFDAPPEGLAGSMSDELTRRFATRLRQGVETPSDVLKHLVELGWQVSTCGPLGRMWAR